MRRQHQEAGLSLSLHGQRYVHGHLVAVEVGVERGAGQRVQLDRATLDQNRLEGLYAQTVQRGRAVQHYGMLADDLFQHVPDLDLDALDHALCALYVVRQSVFDQALHYEGLEQLQRHFLRQTALPHLQRRAYDYNASAGVVDALAQQVLAETALLTAQQIAQALERAAAGAGHGAAAATIINQGIDGFLKHTLFVAHNDVGRAEFEQTLQAVITVNYAAVQIVQVAGGEAAALQLNHRAQFRRNYGYYIQYHPLGLIAAGAEGLDDLQALYYAGALLTLGLAVALLLGQLVNLLAQAVRTARPDQGSAASRAQPRRPCLRGTSLRRT